MRALMIPIVVAAFILSGCAGSPPKAKFVQAPAKSTAVDANDTANIAVKASAGVDMLEYEISRLTQVIAQKLNEKKLMNSASNDEHAYDVEVTITRYKKGNAFARAMLAGLGQIHIDARVRLLESGTQEQLSAFDIKKTFAWGGIYGGTTRIDDVEPAFAEGIAAALTGTEDSSESE